MVIGFRVQGLGVWCVECSKGGLLSVLLDFVRFGDPRV